jgi:hypothetical protein
MNFRNGFTEDIPASFDYFIFGPFIVQNTKTFDFEANKNYFLK